MWILSSKWVGSESTLVSICQMPWGESNIKAPLMQVREPVAGYTAVTTMAVAWQ